MDRKSVSVYCRCLVAWLVFGHPVGAASVAAEAAGASAEQLQARAQAAFDAGRFEEAAKLYEAAANLLLNPTAAAQGPAAAKTPAPKPPAAPAPPALAPNAVPPPAPPAPVAKLAVADFDTPLPLMPLDDGTRASRNNLQRRRAGLHRRSAHRIPRGCDPDRLEPGVRAVRGVR